MDTVKTLNASSLSAPARRETRAALDSFFRSFGFTSDAELSQLANWALAVPGGHMAEPQGALAQARARMETWLLKVFGNQHAGETLLARGRAAFVLSEAAQHGAALLLAEPSSLPQPIVQALRSAMPVPSPKPVPSVMREQQLVLNPLAGLLRRWWRAESADASVEGA
ncbi:hypothetical protein STIAU_4968 [Stigmatella aurantiaca DW4/3-1]|uniref:Uncharacterized protein n=1 Tax=Stigmatella aurantiaca (strain DW4/3-1) TaxID=378806 RepID=Q094V8_STIAD|nr:hypothetical protein STIAU_4968 [Stigmatella aurantiaca DW4/3-1]